MEKLWGITNQEFYILQFDEESANVVFRCPAFKDNKFSKLASYALKSHGLPPYQHGMRLRTGTPMSELVSYKISEKLGKLKEEI